MNQNIKIHLVLHRSATASHVRSVWSWTLRIQLPEGKGAAWAPSWTLNIEQEQEEDQQNASKLLHGSEKIKQSQQTKFQQSSHRYEILKKSSHLELLTENSFVTEHLSSRLYVSEWMVMSHVS